MDNVNKPKHYTSGKIEVIDYIKDKLTPEQYKGYLLGNVIKYTSRFQLKNGLEDLEKGRVYLDWLAKVESGEVPQPSQGKASFYGKGDTDQIIPTFKVGDKVRKVNGDSFRNAGKIVTVSKVDEKNRVWFKETLKFLYPEQLHYIEKVPTPIMKKSISQLCKEAYENAAAKGWHDKPRSFGDVIALIHSELSEALEDHRNGYGVTDTWYEYSNGDKWNMPAMRISGIDEKGKPCGIPSELADVCIRIFDFCGEHGIDLEGMITEKMAYNATRPNRHGGKTL